MENVCLVAVGFVHNKSGFSQLTMKFGVVCVICHYPVFVIIQHSFGTISLDTRGIRGEGGNMDTFFISGKNTNLKGKNCINNYPKY